MRRARKLTALLAALGVAALALTGCVAGPTEAPADSAPVESVPEETRPGFSFEDDVLTTPDVVITITAVETIPAGEAGNEDGSAPVLAYWYDITNLTSAEITPQEWLRYFAAYQDESLTPTNELQVAALADDRFVDSQLAPIPEGATVASAVAYELTDEETPIQLIASADGGVTEIERMIYSAY